MKEWAAQEGLSLAAFIRTAAGEKAEKFHKADAAKYMSVSTPTFRQIVRRGKIPFYLLDGGTKRYRTQDIDKYMRAREVWEKEEKK